MSTDQKAPAVILRDQGIYQAATIGAWLAHHRKMTPRSSAWQKVMQGEKMVEVDGISYVFEPLDGGMYKVRFADAAELKKLFDTLDEMTGIPKLRIAATLFFAFLFVGMTALLIVLLLPYFPMSRGLVVTLMFVSMVVGAFSGHSLFKR